MPLILELSGKFLHSDRQDIVNELGEDVRIGRVGA